MRPSSRPRLRTGHDQWLPRPDQLRPRSSAIHEIDVRLLFHSDADRRCGALLNQFATGTTNTTITDLESDKLTLNGVTIATLEANLADFKFT